MKTTVKFCYINNSCHGYNIYFCIFKVFFISFSHNAWIFDLWFSDILSVFLIFWDIPIYMIKIITYYFIGKPGLYLEPHTLCFSQILFFNVSFFSVTFTITTIILVKVVDNILLQNYSSSSLDINVAYCLFIIFLNLFVRMFIDWKQWHLGKCLFAFLYWCITKISKLN